MIDATIVGLGRSRKNLVDAAQTAGCGAI